MLTGNSYIGKVIDEDVVDIGGYTGAFFRLSALFAVRRALQSYLTISNFSSAISMNFRIPIIGLESLPANIMNTPHIYSKNIDANR